MAITSYFVFLEVFLYVGIYFIKTSALETNNSFNLPGSCKWANSVSFFSFLNLIVNRFGLEINFTKIKLEIFIISSFFFYSVYCL